MVISTLSLRGNNLRTDRHKMKWTMARKRERIKTVLFFFSYYPPKIGPTHGHFPRGNFSTYLWLNAITKYQTLIMSLKFNEKKYIFFYIFTILTIKTIQSDNGIHRKIFIFISKYEKSAINIYQHQRTRRRRSVNSTGRYLRNELKWKSENGINKFGRANDVLKFCYLRAYGRNGRRYVPCERDARHFVQALDRDTKWRPIGDPSTAHSSVWISIGNQRISLSLTSVAFCVR